MQNFETYILLGVILFFFVVGLVFLIISFYALIRATWQRRPDVSIWRLLDRRAFLIPNDLFTIEGTRWCRLHRYFLFAAIACFISLPVNLYVIFSKRP